MSRGLTPGKKFVSKSPVLNHPLAKFYRFGYSMPTPDPTTNEMFYTHILSNGSTFMDNLSRTFEGDKYYYGEPVVDFPRNAQGNIVDEPTKKGDAVAIEKPKKKVKA